MKRITVLLAALGALLLVAASPAFAAGELELKETFGSAAQPTFNEAAAIAVDPASGDVYVADLETQTLHRYKPNGEADPFAALSGSNVIDGVSGPDETPSGEIFSTEEGHPTEIQVAIAPPGSAGSTAGDIYVTNALDEVIDVFAPSGEFLAEEALGFDSGVAVDSAGNVYVGDYYEGIHKLIPSAPGSFTEAAGSPFGPTEIGNIAVGFGPSAGYVFALEFGGSGSPTVAKVEISSGETKYSISELPKKFAFPAVDPVSGYLYVGRVGAASEVAAYDVSGASSATEVAAAPSIGSTPYGLAVNGSTEEIYVARQGQGNVSVYQPEEGGEVGPPLTTVIEQGSGTVVSNPAGIECTGSEGESCTTEEIEAGTVTLTASPATGYRFKSWKGCDKKSGEFGVNGRQCTISLTEARSVSAKFVKTWDVTIENGGNGKVSTKPGGALCLPNCSEVSASFDEGKNVEVLTKPNKHFHFVSWGGDCSGSGACEFAGIAADHTVSATFAEDTKYALSLAKQGGGQALIKTKPPGMVCSYTCGSLSAGFYEGEVIEVKWKLGKGTSSIDWSTGAGTCTGSSEAVEGVCTVTMSAAKELVADLG